MPTLSRIRLYPIKALDAADVQSAGVLLNGALRHDREFAMMDSDDVYVNGKNKAAVHRLRATYDAALEHVTLAYVQDGQTRQRTFHLRTQFDLMEPWLSRYFAFPITLKQNWCGGHPDDTAAPGPTLISTATLETIATWFPSLSIESLRRRFRANLEISGVPPFWEDRLYSAQGQNVPFAIGDFVFEGTNPCQRCAVPTRDPDTGEIFSGFQKLFMQCRKETLPLWANATRFNHFYRLTVNTRLKSAPQGAVLRTGDPMQFIPN